MIQRVLESAGAAILSPLIQEARERQRRRQAAMAKTMALAAVLALATAAGRGGGANGLQAAELSDGTQAAVQADVARTVSTFDHAVAAGDFASACSLLDPGMGMTTVRTATSAVGVGGNCGQRLAGFVRIIGPTLLAKLENATVGRVEFGGSEARGFDASAAIQVSDNVIRQDTWFPVVGVAKASGHARVLITCPPLLCAWRFLNEYPQLARAEGVPS
jgi:hypothetical protein